MCLLNLVACVNNVRYSNSGARIDAWSAPPSTFPPAACDSGSREFFRLSSATLTSPAWFRSFLVLPPLHERNCHKLVGKLFLHVLKEGGYLVLRFSALPCMYNALHEEK